MINVTVIENLDEYRKIIGSVPHSFLQSPDWGLWQKSLGRDFACFAVHSNAKLVLACLVLNYAIPGGQSYVYAPYGPVVLDEHNLTEHISALSNEVRAHFPGSLFLKLETQDQTVFDVTFASLKAKKSTRGQAGDTLLMDLQKSEEELLAGMHPKTRYNIKVASKHDVTLQREYNEAAVQLLYETGTRQKFRTHEHGYYEKMLSFFKEGKDISAHLLYASKQNTPLAAGLYIDYCDTRTYLFGGSDYTKRNLMAPYLLHFEAMLDAQRNGKKVYDFWGVKNLHGKEVGFTKFKLGFGGTVVEYPEVLDIVFKPVYYKLFKMIKTVRRIF